MCFVVKYKLIDIHPQDAELKITHDEFLEIAKKVPNMHFALSRHRIEHNNLCLSVFGSPCIEL